MCDGIGIDADMDFGLRRWSRDVVGLKIRAQRMESQLPLHSTPVDPWPKARPH